MVPEPSLPGQQAEANQKPANAASEAQSPRTQNGPPHTQSPPPRAQSARTRPSAARDPVAPDAMATPQVVRKRRMIGPGDAIYLMGIMTGALISGIILLLWLFSKTGR